MTNATIDRKSLLCPEGFQELRLPMGRAWARQDVSAEQLTAILSHDAETLKESSKSRVRRIGHWVLKETRGGLRRRAARRQHDAWMASHFLRAHGVRVPEPLALIERKRLGVLTGSVHIFQYLGGCRNVEHYLSDFIHAGTQGDVLAAFLERLAASVNAISAAGAYHSDLSGKNIFTKDGVRFYFIDLDAVEIGFEYTDEKRLKNHVQLYDSFCDALSDTLLVPFIQAMTPSHLDLRVWMPTVRSAQEKRRAKVEAYWARHGRPDNVNPLRSVRELYTEE